MITNVIKILQDKKVDIKDTVYFQGENDILSFPFSAGDFFDTAVLKENNFRGEMNDTALEQINTWLAAIKEVNDKTHEYDDKVKLLRQERKDILKRNIVKPIKWIIFKNQLYCTPFDYIAKVIPLFKQVSPSEGMNFPWFTNQLPGLAEALAQDKQIAISGGPCLFGTHEMEAELKLKSGESICFDFSSGSNYKEGDTAKTHEPADYIEEYREDIEDIKFINHKQGVTSQEYESIYYLFEYADKINAKLTIPIPDMSYIKYLKSIIKDLPDCLYLRTVEAFREQAWKITDMYLEVTDSLSKRYPKVDFVVVHEREKTLCDIYYREREKYFSAKSIRKNLTGVRGKIESVLDYITMPALPFYIWGIRDIIQMDSLDEADSYRKCRKIHKNNINLYAMLYPERLSKDGENTIFYAMPQYKEYLTGEKQYETYYKV